MFFTGIDQHKHSSVLTTVTATGERLRQVTLPNDRAALLAFFRELPGPHQAVVEATGRWYWLRDLLAPAGVEFHLAHAKLLKAIAYAKVKTDAVDSTTLAQLFRSDLVPEAHMIREALRGPRSDRNWHGSVDCLIVNGNRATVGGGVILRTREAEGNTFELIPGTRWFMQVVDNGEAAGSAPDERSGSVVNATQTLPSCS